MVKADDAFGDRSGGEGGDRVRLACARAGLEHDRLAEREITTDIEGGHRNALSNGPYVSCASLCSPPRDMAASPRAARSSKKSSHVTSTSKLHSWRSLSSST